MPLRYADPTRKKSAFARGISKVFGTAFGQLFIKYVAARTDPWLGRISKGRLSWSLGIVPTATLRTTGAKSGQPREVQLTYFHDGPDPIVVASHYGGATDPQWSRNLSAHPDCEFGGDAFRAAEVTDPQEYTRLYALAEQVYAGYAEYKVKTSAIGRHIPIFRLTPRYSDAPLGMSDERIDLIHDLVTSAARVVPDRVAIIGSDGAPTTFAEFDAQVRGLAAGVAAQTRRGDRIAVIADNGPDYALLYYGVPRSGRILTLINQRLSPDEQRTQLTATEPTILVGDSTYLAALGPVAPTTRVIAFDEPEWRALQLDSANESIDAVAPDDPAWLLFTSGSTGVPKGVVHTHRSITTAVRGTAAGRSVRPGGVYLLPFPMCHIAGYNMLVHHSARSTVLPVPVFRPDLFAAAVNAHAVTSCSLAPTMLHSLLAYLDESGMRLPTLREIAYGSAAIPAELLRRAIAQLDVDFHQGYGMTETGGNVTFLGPAEHRAGAQGDASVLATAGTPHAEVEVRIAEDSGEILLRGAQVASAYWQSDSPIAVDGWFHTGDVGRIDDEGRLQVVDRLKDVIITGGENVSSREVEDVLSSHPDVDMVAVVGVPDDYWGETICAVVVARQGGTPSADELIAFVRSRIAAFKRPRRVLFVDALPLTTNGKVAKVAVRRFAANHR